MHKNIEVTRTDLKVNQTDAKFIKLKFESDERRIQIIPYFDMHDLISFLIFFYLFLLIFLKAYVL